MTQYADVCEQNNEELTKDKNYEKKWRKKNGPPFIDFTMLVVFMSQPHVVNQNWRHGNTVWLLDDFFYY
jgi:hypothetical protein